MADELLEKTIYVFAMLSRESFGSKSNNLTHQLEQIIRNLDRYSNIFIPPGISSKCNCSENDIIQGLKRLSASLPSNNPLKKLMSNFGFSTKLVIPSLPPPNSSL